MSVTVSKSRFKPKALEYFRKVQESGHELVITEHGKPVLKIIPYVEDPEAALRALRHGDRISRSSGAGGRS